MNVDFSISKMNFYYLSVVVYLVGICLLVIKYFLDRCKYFVKTWSILVVQDFVVVVFFRFVHNIYYYI